MATSGYEHIADGGSGWIERPRGLLSVKGSEAIQFLDGMITNNMKTLGVGAEMLAAFPNAQGRLLALVRILRDNDRSYIETEEATHEALYQNLFKFTFAGDFQVEDVSDKYRSLELFGKEPEVDDGGAVRFRTGRSSVAFVAEDAAASFMDELNASGAVELTEAEREILRIEAGHPEYGIDMDDTTVVPELGLGELIAYDKGCYIGQEIIARIHFRGHVAKQLTGLVLSGDASNEDLDTAGSLQTAEGKDAGRITSRVFSPRLQKTIALGFVRYDHLSPGTELFADDMTATVTELPFV